MANQFNGATIATVMDDDKYSLYILNGCVHTQILCRTPWCHQQLQCFWHKFVRKVFNLKILQEKKGFYKDSKKRKVLF